MTSDGKLTFADTGTPLSEQAKGGLTFEWGRLTGYYPVNDFGGEYEVGFIRATATGYEISTVVTFAESAIESGLVLPTGKNFDMGNTLCYIRIYLKTCAIYVARLLVSRAGKSTEKDGGSRHIKNY
jgi:hypothetical protein